ncbi:MAG: hypothetical protein AAB628_03445 [Patescibacteria group bacterium]
MLKTRGFIRGGNWDNGVNSGAFTLNLNNAPGNVNTNIGFRCARFSGFRAVFIPRPESCFLKTEVSRLNPRHLSFLGVNKITKKENINPSAEQ